MILKIVIGIAIIIIVAGAIFAFFFYIRKAKSANEDVAKHKEKIETWAKKVENEFKGKYKNLKKNSKAYIRNKVKAHLKTAKQGKIKPD